MFNALHSILGLLLPRFSFGGPGGSKRRSNENPDRRNDSRAVTGELAMIEWVDEDGISQREAVNVRDRSPRGLGLRVSRKFPIGLTVWITEDPRSIVKAVVRHCHGAGDAYLAGVVLVNSERRRRDRQPVKGDAMAFWGSTAGEGCSSPVEVLNATEFGLQIQSPIKLPVPAIVKVVGALLECSGSTCYCLPKDNAFLVGVHLVRHAYDKDTHQYNED